MLEAGGWEPELFRMARKVIFKTYIFYICLFKKKNKQTRNNIHSCIDNGLLWEKEYFKLGSQRTDFKVETMMRKVY